MPQAGDSIEVKDALQDVGKCKDDWMELFDDDGAE